MLSSIRILRVTRARAQNLAVMLGINEQLVCGQIQDLMFWALNPRTFNDNQPGIIPGPRASDMIEAMIQWRSRKKRGFWVQAAISVGLLRQLSLGIALAEELVKPNLPWVRARDHELPSPGPDATGYVYLVQRGERGPIKIGYSQRPMGRIASLQTACPEPLRLLKTLAGTRSLEGALHERFASHRLEGEWFSPAPEILAMAAEGS